MGYKAKEKRRLFFSLLRAPCSLLRAPPPIVMLQIRNRKLLGPPPIASIKSLGLGLIDDRRIQEIATAGELQPIAATRKNMASLNSVLDPRLGTSTNTVLCLTCGQDADLCQGHAMSLAFPQPLLNGLFHHLIHKILTCICFRCSSFLVPRDHYKIKRLKRGNLRKRVNEIYGLSLRHRVCMPVALRAGHDGTMLAPEEALEVGYCGAVQPVYWVRHAGVMVRPVFDTNDDEFLVPDITMDHVYEILQNVSKETASLIGFHPERAPMSALCVKKMLIPPVLMRPSRSNWGGGRPQLPTAVYLYAESVIPGKGSGRHHAERQPLHVLAGRRPLGVTSY